MIFHVVSDAMSALNLEPSFDLKFTDGALNGLDALAGRVGNRLMGRHAFSVWPFKYVVTMTSNADLTLSEESVSQLNC